VYAAKNNRRLEGLSDEALDCLEAYSWPGNVRELENVVERAVVLARGARVETAELPGSVVDRSVVIVHGDESPGADAALPGEAVFKIKLGTPLAEVQQRVLEETLRMTKGNKTLAARILKIDPTTVFRKLKAGEADKGAGDDRGGADRGAGS
jgi:two-component system response regulator HydG